ncbi:hypothetical protein FEAC_26120 [Ferrimicrobium acidiphilum DSM 19497]|jgi:hypothetical protein|uniref:Uncharacterized protein n=2 Tax=Ferrimicrobium acidiphilum TaxID=121039 RepID=A0A0D8FTS0_9ACTN|nr:hypothetical protein FEAC_26120 [Ferrimicrobium acidiphilum DSM 19497]
MSYMDLTVEQRSFLSRLTYYIWWQSAEESLARPERLIAQIMDIGDWDDERNLEITLGAELLRDVLTHAEPGWFRPKSWSFWNYRLKVVLFDAEPPEMPYRSLSA